MRIAVLDDDRDFCVEACLMIERMISADRLAWAGFVEVVSSYDFRWGASRPDTRTSANRDLEPAQLLDQLNELRRQVETDGRDAAWRYIAAKQVPTFIFCDAYMPDVFQAGWASASLPTTALAVEIRRLVAALHQAWGPDDRFPFTIQFWSRESPRLGSEEGNTALTHDPYTDQRYPWARYCEKPRLDARAVEEAPGHARKLVARLLTKHFEEDERAQMIADREQLLVGEVGSLLRMKLDRACTEFHVAVIVCAEDRARRQAVEGARRLLSGNPVTVRCGADYRELLEALQRDLGQQTRFIVELPPDPRPDEADDLGLAIQDVVSLARSGHRFVLSLPRMGAWEPALRRFLGQCIVEIPPLAQRAGDVVNLVRAITQRAVAPSEGRILAYYASTLSYDALFGLPGKHADSRAFGTNEDWAWLTIDPRGSVVTLRLVHPGAGREPFFELQGDNPAPHRIDRGTQPKNFNCTLFLLYLAVSPPVSPPVSPARMRFPIAKRIAERIKQAHPLLWHQSGVKRPLFDAGGKLRARWSADSVYRMPDVLNEWLGLVGARVKVDDVGLESGEVARVRMSGQLTVRLDGVDPAMFERHDDPPAAGFGRD